MGKITPKGKKVTGTKKKDKITWVSSKAWKKALTVNAGSGNDLINFKKSNYNKNKLFGQAGNDTIYGGKKTDSIDGGTGKDKLYGYNGNDTIKGGKGNDSIYGGNGNDKLYGNYNTNIIKGDAGNDSIYGGTGIDKIWGGNGNDFIKGGKGNDIVYGENNNDKIYGEAGADQLNAGAGNDYIDGGNDNDKIWGISGNNTLLGGSGNDTIYAGTGDDKITGGTGNDLIDLTLGGNNTIYAGNNEGNDTIISGTGTDSIVLSGINSLSGITSEYNGDDLVISLTGTNLTLQDYKKGGYSIERIYTGDGTVSKLISKVAPKNVIENDEEDDEGIEVNGTPVDDEITFRGTKATIYGGNGDDIINSFGTDTVYGGSGDDTIDFAAEDLLPGVYNKEVHIAPDEGNDSIKGIGCTLETNIIFDESASLWAERNEANDLVLKSLAYKNNQYYEQETAIQYGYNSNGTINTDITNHLQINGNNFDISKLTAPYRLTEEDENAHSSTVAEFVIGTSGNDTITGSDENDTFYGADGDDEINGKGGDDVIYLGSGNSTVKIDMSVIEQNEWGGYEENCVKTIYMKDDSVLTLDFDYELLNTGGTGIFCRGTGLDNDLYISIDGGMGYCIRVKDYFDENRNPKTDKVLLKTWGYTEESPTEMVQLTYTVPEWANGSYWGRTFDIQPFGPYEGEIRGTNMPYEWLLYSGGFGKDDTIYGGNGNTEVIYIHHGHDIIYANEGVKKLSISGNQTNSEIYLGSAQNTKTTIYMGGVNKNLAYNIDEEGNLNISWECLSSDLGNETYTSTAKIHNWTGRTSQAEISIQGDSKNNLLTAFDGVPVMIDGGSDGNDTLVGGANIDTFNFTYNNGFGIDTVINATSDDILQFESMSSYSVDFTKFKFYKNDNGNGLVIKTKSFNNKEGFAVIKDYFTSTNKVDKIVAYNWESENEEKSLAALLGDDITQLGCFEYADGNTYTGTDYEDIMIGNSGTNTFEAGEGNDLLYTYGGTNTFVFNEGDGSDILYQQGGESTILEFKNATFAQLTSQTGYDREVNGYYLDLLIHYDGENTLRVKDFYDNLHNVVTQIKDSTGTVYNAADCFKRVEYINSISDYYMRQYKNTSEELRITSNVYEVEGGGGSDRIYGCSGDEYIFTHNSDWNFVTFDKTAGVVDEIHAGAGDDMLVGQSSTNYLYGDEGDDSFLVFLNEGLNTFVSDSSGTSDSMNLYDETYNNIHFVFNVDNEGNIDDAGLRILNNDNFDLWKANISNPNITGISVTGQWNAVEAFEEAGDENGCSHLSISAIETVKADIASWLATNGYEDVADVFTNEKTEGDINTLVAKFDVTTQWQYEAY